MAINKDSMASVEINILGQTYKIKGDASEEYIREVARYVEGKIKEVLEKSPGTSPLKAAILAAMNIADELKKTEREHEALAKDIESKAEQLFSLFE
ncbi:MAG: cell division protein ZapA [Nitrospirae bacterium]|nr:MAG: cell division protein ZapA [Nitrospirota bacterium]